MNVIPERIIFVSRGITVQPWTGPEGSGRLMLPEFLDSQHLKVVRLSAPRAGRLYIPGGIPDTHFFYRLSRLQGHIVVYSIMIKPEHVQNFCIKHFFSVYGYKLDNGRQISRKKNLCLSTNVYVLLTVHPNVMRVFFFTNLMHKFFILIHLLHSSTCFEHYCAHLQEDNCINTASGIVTLFG